MNTEKLTSLESFDEELHFQFCNKAIIHKDFNNLIGMLDGIASDGKINKKELEGIEQWISDQKYNEFKNPYKNLIIQLKLALSDQILTDEEIGDIIWYCKAYIDGNEYYNSITSSIQKMLGIVKGIILDKSVNKTEILYLDRWLEENEILKNIWPYDELYNITTKVINKKIYSEDELQVLIPFFESLAGNSGEEQQENNLLNALKTGHYQIDPLIEIPGRTFCITGVSQKYKRKEIADKIELYGGYISNSVTSKINYLLVCDNKNTCWAFTCYGRKIEQAVKHRKNGANLIIVHESDFFDSLENYK